MIVVYFMHMLTPMPDGPWRLFGGLLVMLLASWGPVVLGFGEPIAAAVMLGNVALGGFAYKTWMERNAES